MAKTATPVAPTTEQVKIRTLAALERAQLDLKSIDLRSLQGDARERIQEARYWTASAIKDVKAL